MRCVFFNRIHQGFPSPFKYKKYSCHSSKKKKKTQLIFLDWSCICPITCWNHLFLNEFLRTFYITRCWDKSPINASSFLSQYGCLLCFSCLTATARTSSAMLNRGGAREQFFPPGFQRKALSSQSVAVKCDVICGFPQMPFILSRKFPFTPSSLSTFIVNGAAFYQMLFLHLLRQSYSHFVLYEHGTVNHYSWFWICDPQINTCGTFMIIHRRVQTSEDSEFPDAHALSWGRTSRYLLVPALVETTRGWRGRDSAVSARKSSSGASWTGLNSNSGTCPQDLGLHIL